MRSVPLEQPGEDERRLLAAIEPLLQAIVTPALFLSPDGEIMLANSSARVVLASDNGGLRGAFVAGVHDNEATPERLALWTLTSLKARGNPIGFLAILRDRPLAEPALARQLRGATSRWRLTERQATVLTLVARGLTNETIADILRVGERTVEFHISRILDKAGAHSRTALIVRVVESAGG